MTRTFYDILGLDQSASQQQVRAAYVRLMKLHHPDIARRGTTPAEDLVAAITLSYATLKDVRKRRAYDAELASQTKHRSGPPLTLPLTRSRSRAGSVLAYVASLLLVLLGTLFAVAGAVQSWGVPNAPNHGSSDDAGGQAAASRVGPPAAEIRYQAHLARTLSEGEAVRLSRRCFEQALRNTKLTSVELCIIFDEAFRYWRKAPSDFASLPIYFTDEVVQLRHSDALLALDVDAGVRLRELRREAFQALLQDVSSPSPEGDSATSTPVSKDPPTEKHLRSHGAPLSHNGTVNRN